MRCTAIATANDVVVAVVTVASVESIKNQLTPFSILKLVRWEREWRVESGCTVDMDSGKLTNP